ncbi:MAG: hypothetical protein OXQ94_01835 [Gemmatimonadota bacterium]|nr:hypothetical protein [Gemmatimonadota bacterium]
MANARLFRHGEANRPVPRYELRIRPAGPAGDRYEVWQVPSAATPQVQKPVRIAGLEGRNLELVQHRILRILAEQRIRLVGSPGRSGFSRPVPEALAVRLGLIFRTLAPMRDRDRMWAVADGIEKMEREEAAYWLGMAIHREHPRRVLAGLRLLLTEPPRKSRDGALLMAAGTAPDGEE